MLSDRELVFVEEYCKSFNGADAARKAGYSEKSARGAALTLKKNPEVQAAIKERLKEYRLTANEVYKRVSDIARANISDYFIVRKVEKPTRLEKHITEVIDDLQQRIEFEEELFGMLESTEDDIKNHNEAQKRRKNELVRHSLLYKKNPDLYLIVDGPVVMEEIAELNLVKIIEDKEKGIIKSYSEGKQGIKIEFYSVQEALKEIARFRGMYKKDNEQGTGKFVIEFEDPLGESTEN